MITHTDQPQSAHWDDPSAKEFRAQTARSELQHILAQMLKQARESALDIEAALDAERVGQQRDEVMKGSGERMARREWRVAQMLQDAAWSAAIVEFLEPKQAEPTPEKTVGYKCEHCGTVGSSPLPSMTNARMIDGFGKAAILSVCSLCKPTMLAGGWKPLLSDPFPTEAAPFAPNQAQPGDADVPHIVESIQCSMMNLHADIFNASRETGCPTDTIAKCICANFHNILNGDVAPVRANIRTVHQRRRWHRPRQTNPARD